MVGMESQGHKDGGKSPSVAGRLGPSLFFLIFFGMGSLFELFLAREFGRALSQRFWQKTPCTIVSSEVQERSDGDTPFAFAVSYRFTHAGQSRTGSTYKRNYSASSTYTDAQQLARKYPAGWATVCYVNPKALDEVVLKRDSPALGLVLFFPLIFVAIGAGGIYFTWRRRPPETEKPIATTALRKDLRGKGKGRYVLVLKFSPKAKFAGLTFFALIWNGITFFVALSLISGLVHGHPNWFGLLFVSPFVAIGAVLIGGVVYQFLAVFNPRPTLELSCGTIPPGGTAELRWGFTGRTGRIEEFTVTLRGVEEAKYRQGTSTYTDHNTFYEMELYRTSAATEIASGQVGFVLPQDTMHSFAAENNKILWSLKVHGRIKHWPDVKESFPITVTPAAA